MAPRGVTMGKKKHASDADPKNADFVALLSEDHRQPVYAVAFWPRSDGGAYHHLAVAGSNRASVYAVAADPETQPAVELRQVYVDNDDGESLFCAAWSWRDAAPLLAVGGARGVAKLVDCRSGRLDVALVGHGNAINDACFHPVDGALLLTASKDESVRLWNARTAVCVAVFAGDRGHRDEVLSVDAHLTGAVFCSAGMDNTVKVWQLDAPAVVAAAARSHEAPRPRDGRPFATVFQQFPAFSSAAVHANYVDCARWAGSLLLSKSTGNAVAMWTPDPHGDKRSPVARDDAAPKGDGDRDDAALVLRQFHLPNADIWFMRFSVDARRRLLAAGNKVGRVLVWDVDDPKDAPLAYLAHPRCNAAVRQVCFSPDSRFVALACDDAQVALFRLHPRGAAA